MTCARTDPGEAPIWFRDTSCWYCTGRADYRFAPSQWETALLCNDLSHCASLAQITPDLVHLTSSVVEPSDISYDPGQDGKTLRSDDDVTIDCWWRHKCIKRRNNCDGRTRKAISNSSDIDFIHGQIYDRWCKNDRYYLVFKKKKIRTTWPPKSTNQTTEDNTDQWRVTKPRRVSLKTNTATTTKTNVKGAPLSTSYSQLINSYLKLW